MIIVEGDASCKFCGRARASYYKHDSGKAICVRCLARYIQKRVKRELSRLKLAPRATVAVFMHPALYMESLTLLKLLEGIERRYESVIIALIPSEMTVSVGRVASEHELAGMLSYDSNYLRNPYPLSVVEDLRSSIKSVSNIGFRVDAVVTPLTLNDLSLMVLYSVFTNSNLVLRLLSSSNAAGLTRVIHAFRAVLRADVLSYAYLSGIYCRATEVPNCLMRGGEPQDHFTSVLEEMVNELAARHPELLFRLVERFDMFSE